LDKLVFAICWYSDPSIFRLLKSLPKECKKIVVDGKFKGNPNPNPLSHKMLRKRVMSFDNVTIIDAPNLSEPEKRNKYLEAMKPGEYLFIIDSDEYIKKADWETFYSRLITLKEGIHHVVFDTSARGGYDLWPRVWANPRDWEYYECHCVFRNKKTGQIISNSAKTGGGTFMSVIGDADDELRNAAWMDDTKEYQKHLFAHEKPIRDKYR
jgi:hypothetical protein